MLRSVKAMLFCERNSFTLAQNIQPGWLNTMTFLLIGDLLLLRQHVAVLRFVLQTGQNMSLMDRKQKGCSGRITLVGRSRKRSSLTARNICAISCGSLRKRGCASI